VLHGGSWPPPPERGSLRTSLHSTLQRRTGQERERQDSGGLERIRTMRDDSIPLPVLKVTIRSSDWTRMRTGHRHRSDETNHTPPLQRRSVCCQGAR